ncbi:MAG: shikimate dehydrogenase [Limnochordales bacterium]|nr:shikimate dehydrogenase [Limnochordales bacterium]
MVSGGTPAVVVTGKTRVLGVIGDPVEHTLSPVMQNAALQAVGLDWVYLPFHVRAESLPSAIGALRALNLVGFNVTIPHKEKILRLVDEVDPFAAWLGAVNTISRVDGDRLKGWNTDGAGFLAALAEEVGFRPQGARVVILGAGGAARAIAGQLYLSGVASLTIVNRTYSRAEKLVEWLQDAPAVAPVRAEGSPKVQLSALAWDDAAALARAIAEADLLVQATAYGMYPRVEPEPPVPARLLHPGLVVCDIVYRPLETALLREARARGARPVTGLGMLVHQGAASFSIWTGLPAPVSIMRRAVQEALSTLQEPEQKT